MSSKKQNLDPELQRQLQEKAALEEEIRRLEEMPDKLIQEEQDRMHTLPPWSEVETRKQEKAFEERASRAEITNRKRELKRSLFLMILLLLAFVSVAWWAYRMLTGMNVLP